MRGLMPALRRWLHRRGKPGRHALLDELLATQALTRRQLLDRQRRELSGIVAHARRNTAYYAARCAHLAEDRELAIGELPILTKDDVRAHLDDLLARDADRAATRIGHTGGSTGQPLAFWYDEAKHELMRAGMMRSYMLSGWRPGEKILNFWGARQDTVAGGVFAARWSDFAAAERTLPAHAFDAARLREWAGFVRSYRPVLLQGYASILAELARHALATGARMPDSLRGVYATAETLHDWQRELMERAFGCKVFNQYGSREIPNIACECRHGNMHVFTDMVWLESLSVADGGNRLLVTSLTNRLMPMIRYDIGDSGRLLDGDCPCGLPFPLLAMELCRANDHIRTPGGGVIHPAYFNRLLYGETGIAQYQFVQQAPDRLLLRVVAAGGPPPGMAERLRASIRADVDARMTLEIEAVAEIGRGASGKHRYVIGLKEP